MNRYKSIFNKNTLLIFLFEVGFGLKYNIVGEISISELFLLIYSPFLVSKIRWRKTEILTKITIVYILLFISQLISEYFVGNSFSSSLKGIAITIVSYLHFIFLFYYLIKDTRVILIIIISQIATKLIWGTSIEEQSAEVILQGEAATFLKFYLVPLITLIILALSNIFYKINFSAIFIFLGLVVIVLGARSSGGIIFITGIISYFAMKKKLLYKKKQILLPIILILLISYGLYVYYVNEVLSGQIRSGNSIQLLNCKNPYNPLELLMMGRREVWVGWQAFMDKFWFGHGAWPYDTTGHYQKLMYEIGDNLDKLTIDKISNHFLIPSHSVLVGSGMMNGVFAFLLMTYLLIFFLKLGINAIKRCDKKNLFILVYNCLNLFWTFLFSPQSHFRQTVPIAFSIILSIYFFNLNNKQDIKYDK